MSEIIKSHGIVLRVSPFSETSQIVHWLTPEHGRLVTLVKGAQRPKSDHLGQFDLFYTCEVLFYASEARAVHLTREISPEKTRDRFRADWRAMAAASYAADVVGRIALPGTPQAELFVLLDNALDTLAENGATPAFMSWFELKLLGALGLAPRLSHCFVCGKKLEPGARRAGFVAARGGLICEPCQKVSGESMKPIPPDVLAALLSWQRSRSPKSALSTRTTFRQMDEIEEFLGRFLRHHLDLPLPSRDIALDLLRRRFGPLRAAT